MKTCKNESMNLLTQTDKSQFNTIISWIQIELIKKTAGF